MNRASVPLSQNREDYSTLLAAGIGLTLLVILALGAYWISDNGRLAAAAEHLSQERVRQGAELYAEQCASCHGLQGEGGLGPALRNKTVLKNTPDKVFFSVIRSGVPNTQMPAWSVEFGGPLTDEDIRNLVAFMRAWEADAPEILVEARQPDASQGALLFSSTCSACHGENGRGGREDVPVLNAPARLSQFDNDWYRSVIANGRPAKGMPTWGTVLSPAQLDDLTALLAAWRDGHEVLPAYSLTELLDLAGYALAQEDASSAELHLARAVSISDTAVRTVLEQAGARLAAGDLAGAAELLAPLQAGGLPGDSQSGAEIFALNCASCHGLQGEGGLGAALRGNAFIQAETNTGLGKLIETGRAGTAMTGFSDRLSEQEIADLIAFLRELQP